MKILVILGSPRKNGNSEIAVRTIADALTDHLVCDTEYIRVTTRKISPCIGCGGCEKTGMCIVQDDMQELYDKVDEADILFLASPTYFYGLSAQIKSFIDRIQARWSRRYLLKTRVRQEDTRLGYLVCTAATHGKRLFEGSILVAKSYFDAVDMAYGGEFLVRGVDEKGALDNYPEELERARTFAREIADAYLNK
jgi:multimeric flavodoxin WrbA